MINNIPNNSVNSNIILTSQKMKVKVINKVMSKLIMIVIIKMIKFEIYKHNTSICIIKSEYRI